MDSGHYKHAYEKTRTFFINKDRIKMDKSGRKTDTVTGFHA